MSSEPDHSRQAVPEAQPAAPEAFSDSRQAFPEEAVGDEVVVDLLAQIEDEQQLSQRLGIDLCPPSPRPEHAPRVYGDLESWLKRSEEVHRFLEQLRARTR